MRCIISDLAESLLMKILSSSDLAATAGASIGLAGLILLKSQGEVLEGLVYGDTGLGDISAAALWGVGLFFCSPYQLLLLFLGKIETERPSDWILQKLGEATGQRWAWHESWLHGCLNAWIAASTIHLERKPCARTSQARYNVSLPE